MTDAAGTLELVTDGAARGNPGPASVAYAVRGEDGAIRFEGAEAIGEATNNEAEYRALIAGLEELSLVHDGPVVHVSDSQLLVRQLDGRYRIKASHLRRLADEARELARGFTGLEHRHVPREDPRIVHVDELANEVLDTG